MDETEKAARMHVCRTCFALGGPFTDTFNRCERVQPRECDPEQPLWNGYDYNCAAELCFGCASAVVSSGSRWSVFFCDDCKASVCAYNDANGRSAIPIGRHSLRNGVSLRAGDARKARRVNELAKGLSRLAGGVERLYANRRARVSQILTSLLEPPGAVPVPIYIADAKSVWTHNPALPEALQ
jgi:hypothetical protein